MILSLLTAAAIITPVNLDDAILSQPETALSDQARFVVQSGEGKLHCLDLPEDRSDFARVCLTTQEWQTVLDLAEADVAQRESVVDRHRSIALAHWNAR